ncbi:MAG: CocE/NonD family hydrolase [Aureispira sp.]|nr:CocE/NonD family hydrolase [Aureispira sp.]
MPHYQLSATHHIDRTQPGVRGMLSAIATAEHYNTTMYHNGVMRQQLAYSWLRGQIFDLVDSNSVDNDLQNALHTPSDYGLTTDQEVLDRTLDYLCEFKYAGQSVSHAYPNSVGRKEIDVSHAPVDANGEGDANGLYSRYTNMDVPTYHLTGWYDIFINGQIDTWRNMRQYGNPGQKIVIGPWAHFTLGSNVSGDQTYPDNVGDVLGFTFDIDNAGIGSLANLDLSKVLSTEPVAFLRQTLNSNGYVKLGEPVVRIPESQDWQGSGMEVRIPSENYDVPLYDFFNYLGGTQNLPQIPIEVKFPIGPNVNMSLPIPNFGAILPFPLVQPITPPNAVDVLGTAPDVRFYVIGPTDSAAIGGNYWYNSNEFPLTGSQIQYTNFYMHQDGSIDMDIPTFDEGTVSYPHDPDNPVQSVGGNNLSLKTPNGRESRGQMDYTDSVWVNLTMNHPGVAQFSTTALSDTLCMIGLPKATLYVKSDPQGVSSGETDTDFFVRVLDVYPDGREFLVVEGAVNARAREYARSHYNGVENDNAPYSNINIGQIYELQFQTLPIAYTFGLNHKIKVLISSSNYPRYQANPNIPIEAGDFFRRQPNDGQTYTFQGQTYSPRIATNSIAFSDIYPSRIELPLFNPNFPTNVKTVEGEIIPALKVQPNPTSNRLQIDAAQNSDYTLRVFNAVGQQVLEKEVSGQQFELSLSFLAQGMYHIELIDQYTQQKQLARVMKL